MKKIRLYMGLLLLGAVLSSCTFEDIPFDKYGSDFVFDNKLKAEGYVLGVYQVLPYNATEDNGYTRVDGAMLASATDEAMITVPGSAISSLYDGSLTSRKTNPDGCWDNNYTFIRDANLGLEGLEALPPADVDLKLQWQCELKWVKAYAYFELLKRYGGVPVLDRAYDISEDISVLRSSLATCVEYICGLCDQALVHLPDPKNVSFGRASTGTALALKARVLLYAASELYNGKGYDGSTNEYICYGTADPDRWKDAASAAADVIKLGYYQLYIPNAISDGDSDVQVIAKGQTNYRKLFITISGNKELILPRTSGRGRQVEIDSYPVGITNAKGLTSPSQQMVDAYGMVDGRAREAEGSVYDVLNPYVNRDPRFYASIFYNGQMWNKTVIETFDGGMHNKTNTSTKTGYYLSKFCEELAISGSAQDTYHCFPLFRYAGVLLDYAEAVNESYGPDKDPYGCGMTARDAVKAVRSRVLRPSDCDVDVASGDIDAMRQAIRSERRIELAFEDHRYYDVKRWKIAHQVLGENIRGMKIVKTAEGFTYTPTEHVSERQFTDKFYVYPIPNGDVVNNPAIKNNNPLW